ncbi:MAG: hypothetical protein ACYSUI_18750 [Planctomycetota bacterium]|jgi:hypothetical protein
MTVSRVFAVLVLLSVPALGANWDQQCNAQIQAVEACDVSSDGVDGVMFGYWVDNATGIRLRDALAERWGYADEVPCTQELVDAGACTAGQIGELVPNPESKRDFADRKLRQTIRNFVQNQEQAEHAATYVEQDVLINDVPGGDDLPPVVP